MNKKMTSFLVAVFMIISLAAVAGADEVTLKAAVPNGETLKAYTLTITSNVEVVDVKAVGDFVITPNNNTPGTLVVSGFSTGDGILGNGAETPVITLVLNDGAAKNAKFDVTVGAFGSDKGNFKEIPKVR